MTLNIKERLLLLNALPQTGNIATLRTVHNLRMVLAFSDEEITEMDLRTEGEQVLWKPGMTLEKKFEFSIPALTALRDALVRMDSEKKLTEEYIPLWDRFVPEKT
jgi:hypothetical protein